MLSLAKIVTLGIDSETFRKVSMKRIACGSVQILSQRNPFNCGLV